MEYKVGDWVKIKRTGQHCHGMEDLNYDGDTLDVEIILWNSNTNLGTNNEIREGSNPKSRWNSFRTREGKPVLFGASKTDYILGLITPNLSYEIY